MTITCPHCSYSVTVPDERFSVVAGRTARCRQCQQTYIIKDERKSLAVAAALSRMQEPAVIQPVVYDQPVQDVAIPSSAPALAPAVSQFQCVSCGGWFDTDRIYSRGDGTYICMRCHHQPAAPASAPWPQQQQPVVIHNVINNGVPMMIPQWNAGVAALLSFILPGLGQMYKGQPINGLCWMVLTIAGYVFFIVPGLVLHLCCIIGATTGDPYRR